MGGTRAVEQHAESGKHARELVRVKNSEREREREREREIFRMKHRKFYAVARGLQPGIYDSWEDCKRQVDGFKGSLFKSFIARDEAERFMSESSQSTTSIISTPKFEQPFQGVEPVTIKLESPTKARGQKSKDLASKQGKSLSKESLSPATAPTRSEELQRPCLSTKVCNPMANQSITFSSQSALEEYLGLCPVTSASRSEANIKRRKLEGAKTFNDLDSCSPSEFSLSEDVYQLEYDGASKGNPGQAGAGALLRYPDGSVLCELTKGLGVATNNVAEYSALILGLQEALRRGIRRIKVQGDSMLVCQQLLGKWQIKTDHLRSLCGEAKELSEKFLDFTIRHVGREYNSDADALANRAVECPNDS